MPKPFYAPGAYIAEVTAQALGKAATGTPQFVLRLRILGKPDPKDPNNYIPVQEYERTMYRAITDKTIDYVIEDLQQLGYGANGFGPLDPGHPQHWSFIGNQIEVYCKHENDQAGNPREKWQLSRGGSTPLSVETLEQKRVRELDALFGKNLAANLPKKAEHKPHAVSAPATVANHRSEEITDDDIPF